MNWEAVGAISEAVGVIAILISLIYVATQIRHSTEQFARSAKATELAAFERNIESGNHLRELLLLHPELAQLMLDGFKSYSNLEKAEKFRFNLLLRNLFSSFQGAYIRHLAVERDPREFAGSLRMLDEILRNRGVREWLQAHTPDWRSEFRKLVKLRLAALKEK